MSLILSRRSFLQTTVAAALPSLVEPASFRLRLGYAAITWDGRDEEAIDDIAALGFRGIQLRSSVLARYGSRPAELRRRLDQKRLALLCFSSGANPGADTNEHEAIETHVARARFVRALGGRVLQIVSSRPRGRAPTPAEYERLGRLLTEIGRRSADLGVRLAYHNHMGGFGEAPDEVARVLEATDPRFVDLLLDIAHYTQGGGDPVAAVTRHRDRLAILHLKDVAGPRPGDDRPYRFVELGRGRVDVPGVIAALRRTGFRGPAVIELDAVTDPARTPKECAAANKAYVVGTLGLSLRS